MINITPTVAVSEHELSFSCDRCPGPGGQNVNKVNTRVTLHFDVTRSVSLSRQQKTTLQKNLSSRISQDGVLRIVSSKERTQLANRRAALNRFIQVMAEAFHTPKPRKPTKVTAGAQARRLDEKSRRSDVKRVRQSKVTLE